jgi:hypothetical protein
VRAKEVRQCRIQPLIATVDGNILDRVNDPRFIEEPNIGQLADLVEDFSERRVIRSKCEASLRLPHEWDWAGRTEARLGVGSPDLLRGGKTRQSDHRGEQNRASSFPAPRRTFHELMPELHIDTMV